MISINNIILYNKIYNNLKDYIKSNRYNNNQTNIIIHNILLNETNMFKIINKHIIIQKTNKNIRITGPYNIKIYKKRCLNDYYNAYDIINNQIIKK